MTLSAIVPALNEGTAITTTLAALAPVQAAGGEVIVVDGGSRDATVACARRWADRCVVSPPGRARQMNVGAALARHDPLWFVHADCVVDAAAIEDLIATFEDASCQWGRLGVRLAGQRPLFRTIAALINLRSRITGIATGDQAIAVRRQLFTRVGGYPDIPLMEDIALSQRLRAHVRPVCRRVGVTTSSRRWQARGAWRTIALMWSLRFAYWRGVSPVRLARRYAD